MAFKENMIFKLDDKKYRIVGNDSIRGNIFIIELCKEVRWPQIINEEELEDLFKNNKAIEVKDNDFMNMKDIEITEEILKKRDFYYEIVCFLLENSNNYEVFYRKSRKCIVDRAIEFNRVERGDVDYRLKANLTLEEITQIIIRCVLFHNNNHVLNHYESDGLTIENNIPKIPSKIWEYGVRVKKGLLRELPEEVIKINLLSNKEVSVLSKGVRLNKLYYVSKYTLEAGWYQRARIEGSFKVRISYDPNNLSEIYYIKEDGVSYDVLTLVSYMEQYKDMSEEEINKIFEYEEILNKEASAREIKEKVVLFDEIEKITKKAKIEQEKVKDKKISKTERLKNIRGNLERERDYYRKEAINNEEDIDEEIEAFNQIIDDEWGDDYE